MSGLSIGLILLADIALPFIIAAAAEKKAQPMNNSNKNSSAYYENNKRQQRQFNQNPVPYYTGYHNNAPANSNFSNNSYNSNIHNQIQQSRIYDSMNSLRRGIEINMNEQTKLNAAASENMVKELENSRRKMYDEARKGDLEGWKSYIDTLSADRAGVMYQFQNIQTKFSSEYQKNINEKMDGVSKEINSKYNEYLDELKQLSSDNSAKQKLAEELAQAYIDEAKSFLQSLENEFDGMKFSPRETSALRTQLNKVITLYNNGSYEAAIASAKDNSVGIIEEIYNADVKKQEWENYQKLAFVLSDEVRTYLLSSEYMTEDIKSKAEEKLGERLPEDMAGVRLADYTAKNKQGKTKYDFLLSKTNEIYNALRSPDGDKLSTAKLKEYVEYLNTKLYPEAVETMSMAALNMSNAFKRRNMSEEIIDFFEEHNFTFDGYAFEDNRSDGALHIGLKNEAAGEEILVTLAPELVNGDIQTKVDIKQTAGDEANEERKQYYRDSVTNVVMDSNPGAEVDIKCCKETFGKLSNDTETKAKIQQQKQNGSQG